MKLTLILVLVSLSLHFDYVNSSSSVQPYEDFSSDAGLQASVLLEFPEWDHFSDFEKVSALRHWAAQRIVMSSSSLFLTSNESFRFFSQNVSSIFRAYRDHWGGVWCGGAAWTLMKLYELFGYEAHYLGSGVAPDATHAETLVYIDVRGTEILSIQDAHFDISYTDEQGNPLDYFEMLSMLREYRHEEIRIVPSPDQGVRRDLLLKANETVFWRAIPWLNMSEVFSYLDDSTVLYQVSFSVASYERASAGVGRFKDLLASEGYPKMMIYIHVFPFQVDYYSSADLSSKQESLDSELSKLNMLRKAIQISQGPYEQPAQRRMTELLQLVTGPVVVLVVSSVLYYSWRKRQLAMHKTKVDLG